jgi:hypothetical protein
MDIDVSMVQVMGSAAVATKYSPIRLLILASGEVELLGEFSEELLRRVLRVVREAVDVS